MNQADRAIDTYVDAINNKNLDALLALFAVDGVLLHPFGTFQGREKLSEFYGGLVMQADTKLTVTSRVAGDNIAVAEVEGSSPQAPETPQYACDVFEVNGEGRVQRLAIYYRNTVGS